MADTTMIRIHLDLKQQLKIQAAKAGLSMNDYLRKLIDEDATKLGS